MADLEASLRDTLKQSIKDRFQAVAESTALERADISEKQFKIKIIKMIAGMAPGMVGDIGAHDIHDLSSPEVDDPMEYVRNRYPYTIFGNMQIIKEVVNMMIWLLPGYKRSDAWKAFVMSHYMTTVFQVRGSSYWVVTQETLNRKPGVPRIRIPAADQFPDADVLPLKVYLEEYVG